MVPFHPPAPPRVRTPPGHPRDETQKNNIISRCWIYLLLGLRAWLIGYGIAMCEIHQIRELLLSCVT